MSDFLYLAASVGLFSLCIAYTWGCEKLRGGAQ